MPPLRIAPLSLSFSKRLPREGKSKRPSLLRAGLRIVQTTITTTTTIAITVDESSFRDDSFPAVVVVSRSEGRQGEGKDEENFKRRAAFRDSSVSRSTTALLAATRNAQKAEDSAGSPRAQRKKGEKRRTKRRRAVEKGERDRRR